MLLRTKKGRWLSHSSANRNKRLHQRWSPFLELRWLLLKKFWEETKLPSSLARLLQVSPRAAVVLQHYYCDFWGWGEGRALKESKVCSILCLLWCKFVLKRVGFPQVLCGRLSGDTGKSNLMSKEQCLVSFWYDFFFVDLPIKGKFFKFSLRTCSRQTGTGAQSSLTHSHWMLKLTYKLTSYLNVLALL